MGVALLTFPQMDYLEKLKTFSLVSVSPSCFGKQPSLTRLNVDVVRARVLVPKRVYTVSKTNKDPQALR